MLLASAFAQASSFCLNEAMENPNVDYEKDVSVQSKILVQRKTLGFSDPARSQMPAQNPVHTNRIVNEPTSQNNEEDVQTMDITEPEQNKMKNTIVVEGCKLNGSLFNGTVNFSEAKIKIFQDGLGINTDLLASVKISFNNLSALNNTIELSWLNLSLNSFKIKCKSLLLT